MKLDKIAQELGLECLTPDLPSGGDVEIACGHASDLLSDVLAGAPSGALLVTLQVHMNVVAVACHCELGAVIFSSGRRPEPAVVQRAVQEGVRLYASEEPTFELVGKLYGMGLRGRRR